MFVENLTTVTLVISRFFFHSRAPSIHVHSRSLTHARVSKHVFLFIVLLFSPPFWNFLLAPCLLWILTLENMHALAFSRSLTLYQSPQEASGNQQQLDKCSNVHLVFPTITGIKNDWINIR